MKRLFALLVLTFAALAHAQDVIYTNTFDDRGGALTVRVSGANKSDSLSIPLDIAQLRGHGVFFGAEVEGADISQKPKSWNGVKVMLIIETPLGKQYPQAQIPTGTFAKQRFTGYAIVPSDATSATLLLGLESVSGVARFDDVRITRRALPAQPAPADPNRPIFRGHDLPRLRGAMAGNRITEADVEYFATTLGGNLLRWQLVENARAARTLQDYDAWLDAELDYLDHVLAWCRKHRVMIVVDLHSPPGGEVTQSGYITGRGDIFRKPEAQTKLIEIWRKIATRYKGNDVIWGFDLMNEPDDAMLAEGCLDWNELALKTGKAVREIDPSRTLIIEPANWGNPAGFAQLVPLDLPNVVYSFHMYLPHAFTHQGVHDSPVGIDYPGEISGAKWDKAALRKAMEPAVAFASRYRVHMFVGEFSAIRTAPNGSAARYLEDVTSIFEELGYDWTYHAYREWQGWSLEHEGPLDKPNKATEPTDRQRVITDWMKKNQRPAFKADSK